MREVRTNIRTYCYREDWFVDVVEFEYTYEAWLYNKEYGVKSLMFGFPKSNVGVGVFLCTVEVMLEVESYIRDYIESYM